MRGMRQLSAFVFYFFLFLIGFAISIVWLIFVMPLMGVTATFVCLGIAALAYLIDMFRRM
ncbi:hypothetical protein KO561_16080 [Radiobacillus kanasensis]|uniref:hypothetical protein n=1 Tax=Radiobacillus kanasensis TaxID=2844358 RepID=UPI001E385E64|nr:hypothetical protein [Radiobacillus kanasensis]UFT98696.1 hypothetical protein KO561_16080 [Radiobacillus kanasensis]